MIALPIVALLWAATTPGAPATDTLELRSVQEQDETPQENDPGEPYSLVPS